MRDAGVLVKRELLIVHLLYQGSHTLTEAKVR